MMKRLSMVALAGAFAVLAAPGYAQGATAKPVSASALAAPVAFTLAPDGSRILYGERYSGRIMRLNPTTGRRSRVFRIPNVAATGEQGLLGLALHPSYPRDLRVWAFVTRSVSGTATNQLLRVRADRSGFKVLRSFPTAEIHNGGRIMFGPDGKLYVVTGENGNAAQAQNLFSLAGKMLRLNLNGTVPSDNPRAGSPIIGYGIRNSFGFTFDPQTGRPWETENGPAVQRRDQPGPPSNAHQLRLGTVADLRLASAGASQHQPRWAQPGAAEALLHHAAGVDGGRLLPPVRA